MKDPIDALRLALQDAYRFHSVWIEIEAGMREAEGPFYDSLSQHQELWDLFRAGTFCSCVMSLASLFDSSNDSISLRSLPGFEWSGKDQALWIRGRELYSFRNKAIAHIDKVLDEDQAIPGVNLRFNDVKRILDECCAVFDRHADLAGLPRVDRKSCGHSVRKLTEA